MTKHKSQKHAFDDGSEDQTLDDLCSYRVLFSLQLCQLCAHSLGMSRDSLASTLHQRMYRDYLVYGKSRHLLQLHGLREAKLQRAASNLLISEVCSKVQRKEWHNATRATRCAAEKKHAQFQILPLLVRY